MPEAASRCMTGDHDEDDRPDQTKANADGMDHAVRDGLAAIVIPRDPAGRLSSIATLATMKINLQ
jgi:hypothetical protein